MSRQFQGSSLEQDARYTNKELELLKSLKFPQVYKEKVDLRKVNLLILKPWISSKVQEYLGMEDEVVLEYVFSLLEENSMEKLDPRKLEIKLTGFLENNTQKFIKELWTLMLSAQQEIGGIPKEFLARKKEEIKRKMELENVSSGAFHRDNYSNRRKSPAYRRERSKSPNYKRRERSQSPYYRRNRSKSPDRRRERSQSPAYKRRERSQSPDRRDRKRSRSRGRRGSNSEDNRQLYESERK